jgi:hypothetical protein
MKVMFRIVNHQHIYITGEEGGGGWRERERERGGGNKEVGRSKVQKYGD